MRFFLLIVWLMLLGTFQGVKAQIIYEGAAAQGMGAATVALKNDFSLWSNQAGLAYLEETVTSGFARQLYGLTELQSIGLGIAHPTNSGTFVFKANYLGIPEFQNQRFGIGYSRKLLGNLSIGGEIKLQTTNIDEYGSNAVFSVELGLVSELIKDLLIGVHIANPVRIQVLEDENLPTIYRLGLAYFVSDKATITLEAEKDIEYPISVKAGLDYNFISQIHLRTGISTQPTQIHFGLGYTPTSNLAIDVAFSQHLILGFTPGIGVSYAF